MRLLNIVTLVGVLFSSNFVFGSLDSIIPAGENHNNHLSTTAHPLKKHRSTAQEGWKDLITRLHTSGMRHPSVYESPEFKGLITTAYPAQRHTFNVLWDIKETFSPYHQEVSVNDILHPLKMSIAKNRDLLNDPSIKQVIFKAIYHNALEFRAACKAQNQNEKLVDIFTIFESIAEDYPPAKYHMALMLKDGEGCRKNVLRARHLLEEISRSSHATKDDKGQAENQLGFMDELEKKKEEAFQWYTKAKLHENLSASTNLQRLLKELYEHATEYQEGKTPTGTAISKDLLKAKKILEWLDGKNYKPALERLGDMYAEGKYGVTQNLDIADAFYERALS